MHILDLVQGYKLVNVNHLCTRACKIVVDFPNNMRTFVELLQKLCDFLLIRIYVCSNLWLEI